MKLKPEKNLAFSVIRTHDLSLRSRLLRFLLAGESESQGEVGGGMGRGGKEKPGAEPLDFTKRRSSTNGRQLGITIDQSRVKTIIVNSLSIDSAE